MRALTVNFAWQRRNPARHMGLVALASAAVVGISLAWSYWQLQGQIQDIQADRQRLDESRKTTPVRLAPEETERLKTELRFASRVIDRLDTPWDDLFEAVETAFNDQVTLLNVEPDTERREVRLTGEAKDLSAMLEYLRQVRQSPVLRDAYLASHQINQQDPQRPVRFVVIARWTTPPLPPAPAQATTVETNKAPAS